VSGAPSEGKVIYLIRHGETELNATRVVQPSDTPLNARGQSQAVRLAQRLAAHGLQHVLCSDLERARMTAAPLVQATSAAIEYTPLLQERNFGDLRGRPYAELREDIFARDFKPPAGESWPEFDARVSQAWQRIAALAATLGGNLAVVTHGLVCGSIASRFLSLPSGQAVPARWGNTSVTTCKRAAPHAVQLLNCVAHLQGDDDRTAPSGL
jgi:2,3-bisphosphoglycerate-dependent phosphoglycerate mutase